jgi:hypothetical protein
MFNKSLEDVTEEDLQALIDVKTETQKIERKTVEYKQCLSPSEDKSDCSENTLNRSRDKIEFLADVSSFANTVGGYLLYGVEADAGLPIKLVGVKIDADKQKQQMENLLRDNIEPRLPYVDIQVVPLRSKPGYSVIILHIRQSWLGPHRVNREGHAHFYVRNSNGKNQLDIAQIRAAFELSGAIADRIRNFRAERLGRIIAGDELPAILDEGAPKLVLHMIPSSAFNPAVSIDMKVFNDYSNWDLMRPLAVWDLQPPTSTRFNLDGIARSAQWTRNAAEPVAAPSGYVQIFRNGIVEAVDITILSVNGNKKQFLGEVFELRLLQAVKKHMELQQFLGVEPPVFIMVSLLGVRGYKIDRGGYPSNYTEEIDRTNLIIPEVILDTFDAGNDHIAEVMRPVFDTTWNTANYPSSPNYDEGGKYLRGWN